MWLSGLGRCTVQLISTSQMPMLFRVPTSSIMCQGCLVQRDWLWLKFNIKLIPVKISPFLSRNEDKPTNEKRLFNKYCIPGNVNFKFYISIFNMLNIIILFLKSHSWFGNLVTNANWSEFWLNEVKSFYKEINFVCLSCHLFFCQCFCITLLLT